MFGLKQIAELLDLEHRTLRYVVDQGLVPGLRQIQNGRGNRRKLNKEQAQLTALAASLYTCGLRGELLGNAIGMGSLALAVKGKRLTMNLESVINPKLTFDLSVIRKAIC